jgi:monoterpene epsilon-lactone hydrolase
LRSSMMLLPLVLSLTGNAQTTPGTPPTGPQSDTAVVTADGTAHITRVVPLPTVLSAEAHANWSKPGTDAANMEPDVVKRRIATQAWQDGAGKKSAAAYPVKITESTMAGVPVHLVDPVPGGKVGPASGSGPGCDPLSYSVLRPTVEARDRLCFPKAEPTHTDRVLICVHGGGFDSDSGSLTESVPIANLTRTRVVSVLYRLAPEHPYPAALDDAIAVYRELLKTYKPNRIAVYGTSAGAILTGEIAARIKQLGLPEPGALGIFSGFGDFTATADSGALFTLSGFTGPLAPPQPGPQHLLPAYTGTTDPHDPVLAPDGGDLHGLPPTLFITSSRDLLLSGTADMERAWRRDGVPTQMMMFDGLPHAFWNDVSLPESREAYAAMARFFEEQLGR